MMDYRRRMVMSADFRPALCLVHDMAQDNAANFDLRDSAVPGRHETLVMIALDPDAFDRCQNVEQQRLVGFRHA